MLTVVLTFVVCAQYSERPELYAEPPLPFKLTHSEAVEISPSADLLALSGKARTAPSAPFFFGGVVCSHEQKYRWLLVSNDKGLYLVAITQARRLVCSLKFSNTFIIFIL